MIPQQRFKTWLPFLFIMLGLCAAIWILVQPIVAATGQVNAICTVDDNAPADYSSIQTAVDDAACTDIDVAAGFYYESVVITRSVSVQGASYTNTIVTGIGSHVFLIDDANVAVNLRNMAVVGGSSVAEGGGIHNKGVLTLDRMSLTLNAAADSGGGIFNGYGATLTVTHSVLSTNMADFGAGIYNQGPGSMTISDSTIASNDANNSGGGIYNTGYITVVRSFIANNTALENGGGINAGAGAGFTTILDSVVQSNFAINGGGVKIDMPVVIDNTDVLSNVAAYDPNGGVLSGRGGGIFVNDVLTLTNSVVSGNNTDGLYGGNIVGYGGGIGVNQVTNGRLYMENTAVTHNMGTGVSDDAGLGGWGGQATVTIVGSDISNNEGIGVYGQGVLTVDNSVVSSNSNGGISHVGTLTITDSLIKNNNSIGGVNSHFAVIKHSVIRDNTGGGVWSDSRLTLNFSTVNGNSSSDSGGGVSGVVMDIFGSAVYNNHSDTNGGGVYSSSIFTLTNSTISGNTANGEGGGVYLDGGGSLSHVTITGNTADFDSDGNGGNGGIRNSNLFNAVTVYGTIIAGNQDLNPGFVQVPDCGGTFVTLGSNLIGIYSGCAGFTSFYDQTGTGGNTIDPLLGPLADNGGPTLTHALLPGSTAIDAADEAQCQPVDQRGATRPYDDPATFGYGFPGFDCDIGAYEFAVCPAPALPFLSITRDRPHLLLSWDKSSREVEVWRGVDPYDLGNFSNIWTNLAFNDKTFTDYDAIGDLQTDNFYAVRGQNACSETSAYSNRVGEIDLGIQPGGNGRYLKLSLISVPLTGTIPATADALAAHIDPNGGIIKVARWSRATKSWVMRTVGSPFGTPDFPVSPGDALMAAAGNAAPASFAWVGDVPPAGSIQYTLVPSNANFITIPLDQSGNFPMTADDLANAIGGVQSVAMWNRSAQSWIIRQVGVSGENFTVRLGRPYVVITDNSAPPVWP